MAKPRTPVVTAVVFVITAVPSILQFAFPTLETALRRDPSAIAAGEWWRLFTSLVVQGGGIVGTVFNLATLAVFGYLAERALGPWRWLALYGAGAMCGQIAGTLWGVVDAGNSIGVCGLAGGLMIAAFRGRAGALEGSAGAFYTLILLAGGLLDGTAGIIATALTGAAGMQLVSHRERLPRWFFPAAGVAAGTILTALADLHGPALLGGLLAGLAVAQPLRAAAPEHSS
ncbi:rhomboid family intramembrane serine protease [Streptosporangium sp. NPDC000396]|uniref:rhomboid family intramembrane serine protease n=1 Tax=Streptosporangium sp. NPDC000396 TaxID=3366185 RepID=UPI0036C20D2E